MPDLFGRVAILGLGLMGGSLGLAIRDARLAGTVAGYDSMPGRTGRAHERGAIDEPATTLADAVVDADLVVLAAPVLAERVLLAALTPHLAPGAIVTDLASTKSAVCGWASALLPDPAPFVGGHPMAGREQSGIEAADGGLFRGAVWCLTPTDQTDPDTLARLQSLVTALGAQPLVLDAARHDQLVAAVSHLPLVAAAALVRTVAADPAWPDAARLAASGFRDTTRVASGDPLMARDICLTNAAGILLWMDAYIAELQSIRAVLAAGDAAIEQIFTAARDARDAWLREHEAR
jgi:prephenate dehydrogenase